MFVISCFLGDLAIGDGVNRHFLSMVMHKLQHGFTVDFGKSAAQSAV